MAGASKEKEAGTVSTKPACVEKNHKTHAQAVLRAKAQVEARKALLRAIGATQTVGHKGHPAVAFPFKQGWIVLIPCK